MPRFPGSGKDKIRVRKPLLPKQITFKLWKKEVLIILKEDTSYYVICIHKIIVIAYLYRMCQSLNLSNIAIITSRNFTIS